MTTLKFTKKDLKNYAGTSVYKRGVEYYSNGNVKKIKTVVNTITAKVYGSKVYTVEYDPFQNKFSCNCPYNGFCKHSVAFGLTLLENIQILIPVTNFNTWFDSIDDKSKLDLLKRLLEENPLLKERLDNLTINKKITIDVIDIADSVYSVLSSLSYEDIFDMGCGYSHYVEDYELINDLIEDALDDFLSDVKDMIKAEQLTEAFDYIFGIYLGIQKSANTEIADYADEMETYLYDVLDELQKLIEKQPDNILKELEKEFIDFYNENDLDNLSLFQKTIELFINNKPTDELKKFLFSRKEDFTAKEILLNVAEKENDTTIMQALLKNEKYASLYLPYLRLLKKQEDFHRINEVLTKFTDSYDICSLSEFVLPQLGKEIYRSLLRKLIENCFKLSDYKKYRTVLNHDELDKFLKDVVTNTFHLHEDAVVAILFFENMYNKVLEIINTYVNSEWGFNSMQPYLDKIAKDEPEKVWDIYQKRADYYFNIRKRDAYATLAGLLIKMRNINTEKTNKLIAKYYNHKPILRALRDEFTKAGIA